MLSTGLQSKNKNLLIDIYQSELNYSNLNLNILQFSLYRGEVIRIIGPSGSGKSTLSNYLVSGYLDKYICVKNHKISKIDKTFKFLPWLTIEKNMQAVINVSKFREFNKIKKVLTEIGMEKVLTMIPERLSQGQYQVAAVCQSMCEDRDIYIFDEVFGSIDVKNRVKFIGWLHDFLISKSKGVVIISHHNYIADLFNVKAVYEISGKNLGIYRGRSR